MTYKQRVAFVVKGQPLPKGRPRSAPGKPVYTPPETHAAEKKLRAVFEATHPGFTPLEGRLALVAEFHRRTRHRVDTDNLVKLLTDALNGVAYVDDEQFEEMHSKRVYGAGDEARTVVRIYEKDVPELGAGDE